MCSVSHCSLLTCWKQVSLIAQPLSQAEECLCKQLAFGDLFVQRLLLAICCCAARLHCVVALFCHKPWVFQGIASYLASAWHSLRVRAWLSSWFQCDSNIDFVNTKLVLWLLSVAVKLHKDRYTHCLPSVSQSVLQCCCCALYHCKNRL